MFVSVGLAGAGVIGKSSVEISRKELYTIYYILFFIFEKILKYFYDLSKFDCTHVYQNSGDL